MASYLHSCCRENVRGQPWKGHKIEEDTFVNREESGEMVREVEELEGPELEKGDCIDGDVDPCEGVGWSC